MTILATSYIDFYDLDEVMRLFFQGLLDDIDLYMSNLYKDLTELHPDNSLFGQICADELTKCIWNLTNRERAAIDYHYNKSEKSRIILTNIYLNEGCSSSFESFAEIAFIEAMEYLSFEILQIL
jgi:hypothetical protein